MIETSDNISLSLITLWEIAIKKSLGKLNLNKTTFELEEICADNNISILPIESRYFETIQTLPLIHRDPFDRMLIATALENDLAILTSDTKIIDYTQVNCIW